MLTYFLSCASASGLVLPFLLMNVYNDDALGLDPLDSDDDLGLDHLDSDDDLGHLDFDELDDSTSVIVADLAGDSDPAGACDSSGSAD